MKRLAAELRERRAKGLERSVQAREESDVLHLADNDYFRLAKDERLAAAAKRAIDRYGLSSSASPLISGFGRPHQELLNALKEWHGFPEGIVWNTGYSANHALLSRLPRKGDVVLADRLIHNSMISGILASGARIIRYRHCEVEHLEDLLERHSTANQQVFVVTESVFSMDGDYPDLKAMAALKERFDFFWVVDEAHAIGWYGTKGSGLVEESGCAEAVDALVGTMGKALGSMGAYTLFHDKDIVRYLVNYSEEFIYSTYLSPVQAVAGRTALEILSDAKEQRGEARILSGWFRARLQDKGWRTLEGDSPIVPVVVGEVSSTLALAERLRRKGIVVGAIRPPTVPQGSSRLRVSLNAKLRREDLERLLDELGEAVPQ